MGLIITRIHIECHCGRQRNNNIFPRRILESRPAKSQKFKEPVCQFSRIWFYLSVILSITNLTLTGKSRIYLIWSWRAEIWMRQIGFCEIFISGHIMHLHLIVRSDPRSTSIGIIKTWSLSLRFGQTLFSVDHIVLSHEWKDSIFIFRQQRNNAAKISDCYCV
jgi:hypothetical protein